MFTPDAVLIERGAEETPMAQRCRARLPDVPFTVVEDGRTATSTSTSPS